MRHPGSRKTAGGGARTHTTFRPLDFESSASANSATPALGSGAKGYEIRGQAPPRCAESVLVLIHRCYEQRRNRAEQSGDYTRSSIRRPRGGPRISRRIIASRKPDVDASNVAMPLLGSSVLTVARFSSA